MTPKERTPWLAARRKQLHVALLALLLIAILAFFFAGGSQNLLFFREDVTWKKMQQRGTWRVGMDPSFPPFEYLDAEGNPVGYDVELAQRLANQWDMEVEIVAVGFDSLIDALQAGKIDGIVSALPYDPRLTKDIAYSEPYFEAGIMLVVDEESSIDDLETLAGYTVGVEWGSMGDMVGRRLQRQEISIELAQYPTPQDAVEALATDRAVDALLIDNVTLRQAQGDGVAIRAVGPALESNPYVIALPLRANVLREQVAEALSTLGEEGAMDELGEKWFKYQ